MLDGTVTSIQPYGCFVDLGGLEGMVHVSELSWNRGVKVEEVDALCSGEAKCRMTSVAPPQGLTLVKVYYSKEEFEARS